MRGDPVQDLIDTSDVSRETVARLNAFAAEVRRWSPAINLVSKASLPVLRERHVADSVQVFSHCPLGAQHWVDIGSGGGFPGVVVAILAAEKQPSLTVTLVESDRRKCTFLREVSRTLDLQITVIDERIESLPPLDADVLSARALAPLSVLLAYARPHLRSTGTALFLKGARYMDEIAEARRDWVMDVEPVQSVTDSAAALLIVRTFDRARQN